MRPAKLFPTKRSTRNIGFHTVSIPDFCTVPQSSSRIHRYIFRCNRSEKQVRCFYADVPSQKVRRHAIFAFPHIYRSIRNRFCKAVKMLNFSFPPFYPLRILYDNYSKRPNQCQIIFMRKKYNSIYQKIHCNFIPNKL